jgi:hypothetical protein
VNDQETFSSFAFSIQLYLCQLSTKKNYSKCTACITQQSENYIYTPFIYWGRGLWEHHKVVFYYSTLVNYNWSFIWHVQHHSPKLLPVHIFCTQVALHLTVPCLLTLVKHYLIKHFPVSCTLVTNIENQTCINYICIFHTVLQYSTLYSPSPRCTALITRYLIVITTLNHPTRNLGSISNYLFIDSSTTTLTLSTNGL